tara:strand:- start:3496 stop:5049 length:1554 start_codon:yes stop_codon:yes gene_type:complete
MNELAQIEIELNYNYGFSWFIKNNIFVKGYVFNEKGDLLKEEDLIKHLSTIDTEIQFETFLKKIKGLFSIIVLRGEKLFAAVDRTRTFPLFYMHHNQKLIVTDNSGYLKEKFDLPINDLSKREFLYTGYVTGDQTLINSVYQIKAGEFLFFDKKTKNIGYSDFTVSENKLKNSLSVEDELYSLLNESISRLIESAQGRTIVIPLSGGYDSRVIATLLKNKNYKKVICFSYGVKNSVDAKISKEVARKLNFPWHFVDYDKIDFNQKLIETREFVDYYNFAFNNVSVFLLQDFFAVKYLNNNNIIPKDSIIVPGHSGDFLVGNHLYPFDKNKISNKSVMKQILKRHYVLNAYLKDNEIEKKLIHQIPNEGLSYSKIDNFNLKERQSKFIVNANRVYEYFGYEHRLPLWDDDLVDFFRKLPFHYKINSILYFKVIIEKIFIPNDVYIIPPDKNKSRLIRTLKEYIPIPLAYCLRYLLHNNKMLNTNVGYFKVLKPMVSKYNIKSYQINGILSKWLIKELF